MGRNSHKRKRTTQTLPPILRPLLPLAIVTLLTGTLGGLARMGISIGPAPGSAVAWHGALLVFGFVGVLVSLERAVVLRKWWAFASPLLAVAGSGLLLAGHPRVAGLAWLVAALLAVVVVGRLLARRPTLATAYMLTGMLCWVGGVFAWQWGLALPAAVVWWAAFVILIVVGERIQFGKLHEVNWCRIPLAILACLLIVGSVSASVFTTAIGTMLTGAGMAAMAAVMLIADASRRSRRPGLLRFVTLGLTMAYVWLLVSGLTWVLLEPSWPMVAHDASIHMVFQGLLIGMVFAHAPIVFPALVAIRMPFSRSFYIHLVLLHTFLAVRVIGDLASWPAANRTGAIGTAVAITLFVGTSASAMIRGRHDDGDATGVRPDRSAATSSDAAVSSSSKTSTQPS